MGFKAAGFDFYSVEDIPPPDTSHFRAWELAMIYEIEPELKRLSDWAATQKRRRYQQRVNVYEKAKGKAWNLVGWSARDPRLRCSAAWDCYFKHIVSILNI